MDIEAPSCRIASLDHRLVSLHCTASIVSEGVHVLGRRGEAYPVFVISQNSRPQLPAFMLTSWLVATRIAFYSSYVRISTPRTHQNAIVLMTTCKTDTIESRPES